MSGYQKAPQQSQQKKISKVNEKPVKKSRQTAAPERLQQNPNSLSTDEMISTQQQLGNQTVQRALSQSVARETSTDGQGNLLPEISNEIQQERGSGTNLPGDVQKEVAGSFRKDFSHVRIHTDDKADKLSRTINARAFTIGSDIFFKRGVFSPSSPRGRDTLLHELTHVVQQSGSKSSGGKLKLGAAGNAHEQEADHMAKRLANRGQKLTSATGGATVQKQGEDEEIQAQSEDEEIQAQSEDEEIQAQSEDEEIQAQSEDEEIQAQSEDEEIQAQSEDEEVQMQPEGGVVQRLKNPFKKAPLTPEEEKKKKLEEESKQKTEGNKNQLMIDMEHSNPESKEYKEAERQLKTFHKSGALKKNPATVVKEKIKKNKALEAKVTKGRQKADKAEREKAHEQLVKSAREGNKGAIDRLKLEDEKKEQEKKALPKPPKPEKELSPEEKKKKEQGDSKKKRREELLATIKDPSKGQKEAQEAEEELKKYHKRTLKSNYSEDAIKERKTALKEKAETGDKDAQAKYQELKKSHPTKGSKFKGFMKNTVGGFLKGTVLPGIKGALGGVAKGATGDAKTLLFGPPVKKEGEEKEGEGKEKGGGEAKGGGEGGMMGVIVHLTEEIATLKQQIAGLQGKKPEEVKPTGH